MDKPIPPLPRALKQSVFPTQPVVTTLHFGMSKPIILCVDDEKTVLNSLRQELEFHLKGAYSFELAESGEEGLEVLEELMEMGRQVQVVITDQSMPGIKGDRFLEKVHKQSPNTYKILLTGDAQADSIDPGLRRQGFYHTLNKPWEGEDIKQHILEAAKRFA